MLHNAYHNLTGACIPVCLVNPSKPHAHHLWCGSKRIRLKGTTATVDPNVPTGLYMAVARAVAPDLEHLKVICK